MDDDVRKLVDLVRQTGFETHCYLKNGYLEKIYENALSHRLRKKGLKAVQQCPLQVFDEDGTLLGRYEADLLIEDVLIVELKVARALDDNHIAQLLAYLKTSRLRHGMLMNFGAERFEVRKFIL